MFKKYVLLGVMVIVGALSSMAFASVTYVPKQNSGMAIVEPGDEFNFRIAHMWNGIFIPSVDVTGLLVLPASSVAGSQGFQQYEYGPALLATGFAAPVAVKFEGSQPYQYGPALLATGFAAPAAVKLEGSQPYQYGPALLATGFAAPAAVKLEGFQPYQYGPALLATGFAAPAATSLPTQLTIRQLENYYRFGFARPGSISLQMPHFYQYGPAILATGFASPAK